MEALGALIGASLVAVSPLVPVLRPVAKAAIKGSLALADVSKGAATAVAYQWRQVVSEASAEATVTDIPVASGDDAAGIENAAPSTAAAGSTDEVSPDTSPATTVSEAVTPVVDDLKRISGVGPKIETWLNNAGIFTFEQLAAADTVQLKQQLMSAGTTYRAVNPAHWAEEARDLAAARKARPADSR